MLNADFASASVLISFGAVLGVTTPLQLIVMAICEIAVFATNEWLGLEKLKVSCCCLSVSQLFSFSNALTRPLLLLFSWHTNKHY